MSTDTLAPPVPAREWDWVRGLWRIAAVVPYLALLAAAYSVFCVTTDDPFITYRYAANIWAGHGIVFNPGERVEGFSSPLHLLVIVLLLKILPSVDILFKAKLLGVLLGACAVFQTGCLARATKLSDSEAWLAQLLVALNINFAVGAVNGLETTLYVCLLLAALTAFLREIGDRPGFASGVWCFLALAARPDFFAVFVLLVPIRVICARLAGRPVHESVLWIEAFLIPALVLEVGRVIYYGQLVPNTYFAKRVLPSVGLQDGLAYLTHPLFPVPLTWPAPFRLHALRGQSWPILSALAYWLIAFIGAVRVIRRPEGVTLFAAVVALIAFVLRFGGDWMPGWRFLVPAVPLLAILQCHGVRLFRGPGIAGRVAAPAAALALWLAFAIAVPHSPWSQAHFSARGGDMLGADSTLGRKWVACSNYLKTTLLPGSTVAYSEMGYAGYENPDLRMIDVRGLTDAQIARLPAQYKGPWGVDDDTWFVPTNPLYTILRQRKPDMILAFSSTANMPSVALGRYYFVRYVGDPRDAPQVIFPALVYRSINAAGGP